MFRSAAVGGCQCGVLAALGMLVGALGVTSVCAQAYPVKPIRMISPYASGGGSDTLARLMGQKLYEAWGQPVVVDNRPGGGGILGAETVARASPDGYTLLVTPSAVLTINPHLYSTLRYDTFKDFAPVTLAANSPYLLVVHPKIPVTGVKELIAYAKANPGKMNYSSSGSGSSTHLAGVLFNQMAAVDIVHIPYKGAAPAIVDLLAGNIQLRFSSVVPALPHVRSGRLRAVAISSAKRYAPLPDTPTVVESGLPGYIVESFYAVMAPAGTPRAIIARLNAQLVRDLKNTEVATHMAADGAQVVGSSPEALATALREDHARWAGPVRDSGARAE